MATDDDKEIRLIGWALRADGAQLILEERGKTYYVVPVDLGARLGPALDEKGLRAYRADLDADPQARFVVRFRGSGYVKVSELATLIGQATDDIAEADIDAMASIGGRPTILGEG